MSADGEAQEAMINLARDLGIGIVGSPDDIRKAIAQKISADRDACETERDRLRAELDAAHDGEDALRSEVAKLRAQIAALQSVPQGVELTEDDVRKALMSNAIDVDVEGVTPRLNRIIVSRLVPTHPQAIQPEERRVGPDEVAPGQRGEG